MSHVEGKQALLPVALRRTLLVVGLGAAMSMLDSTIVNVALDSLAEDLGTSVHTIQWVVTAYLLAMAAVVPTIGWLVRSFGPRQVYLCATVVFTAASAACALATSASVLIALRAVQGGAGGLLAAGQLILARTAEPRHLARAMSLFGLPLVLGPIAGPALGGLILHVAGWRAVFFVIVPFGVLAAVLAARLLPRTRPERLPSPDLAGLLTITLGAALLTFGITQVGDESPHAEVWAGLGLVGGAVLIVAFVMRSLRVPNPVLRLQVFREPVVAAAAVSTFFLGGLIFGAVVIMPLYFQIARGESPLATGLLLVPQGLGSAAGIWMSGRVTERLGSWTVVVGALLAAVSTVPLAILPLDASLILIGAVLVARGFGIGLAAMPATTAAFRAVGPRRVPDVSPVLTLLQRVGGSLFTAVFVLTLTSGSAGLDSAAFGQTFWLIAGISMAAAVAAVFLAVGETRSALRTKHEAHSE